MSYENNIQQEAVQTYAELYKIRVGVRNYYYTSYSKPVQYNANTYLARPVKRGALKEDSKLQVTKLKVTMPLSFITNNYIASTLLPVVFITITKVFLHDKTSLIIFSGDLLNISFAGQQAECDFESEGQLLRQPLLSLKYQCRCNHVLYNENCGLNNVDWKFTGVATTVTAGKDITMPDVVAADDYYTSGYAVFGEQMRLITKQTGTLFSLNIPFYEFVNGSIVTVYAGCDKTPEICKTKFNNFTNFLGFPYIPSKNVITWGF